MVEWTILLRDKDGMKALLLPADSVEDYGDRIQFYDHKNNEVGTFDKRDIIGYFKGRSVSLDITVERFEPEE